MKRNNNILKEKYLFIICIIILFAYYVRNISELKLPSIIYDEIGYWANAAYFKGYSWSSIMGSFSSYYSYGISFILYLLMLFIKDPQILHQAAIMLNILMVILCYIMLNYVIKKLFIDISDKVRYVICIIPFFYPSVQYHTQTVWAETYLMFIFMWSVLVTINMYEKSTKINHFLFAILLSYMYMIHQRSIGILIIGFLFVVYLRNRKINRIEHFIIYLFTFLALMIIAIFIKKEVQINVFTDTEVTLEISNLINVNDFGGQISKIKYMFSIEGFLNFCISYIGKLFYFSIASLLLGLEGIVYIVKEVIESIKKKNIDNKRTIIFAYILLSYLVTVFIAAVFTVHPLRWDAIAYGRYTDWITLIFIVIGIQSILQKQMIENIKTFIKYTLVCLNCLIIFLYYTRIYDVSGFFNSCSPIMGYFFSLDEDKFFIIMTLAMVNIACLVFFFSVIEKKYMRLSVMGAYCIVVWSIVVSPAIDELIRIQNVAWVEPIAKYAVENECNDIYYYYTEQTRFGENAYTAGIQYLLQDRKIKCIKDIELIESDTAMIFAHWNTPTPKGYYVVDNSDAYKILRKE